VAWLTRISAPAAAAVSLADVKKHLKVLHADEDDLIDSIRLAAIASVEGRDGVTGRALITQGWEYRVGCWPGLSYYGAHRLLPGLDPLRPILTLPLPPLQSVESVKYIDGDGVEQTLDATVYEAVTARDPGGIRLARGQSWPSLGLQEDAVRIRFTCGYGDAASEVPTPIAQAIKLLCGHWYVHRDTVGEFDDRVKFIHRALLDRYRMRVLA